MKDTRRRLALKIVKTIKGYVVMNKDKIKSSYFHSRCEAENARTRLMVI